jgi:hypothetical protein
MEEMNREMVDDFLASNYSKTEYELMFQRTEENQELFNLLWTMAGEQKQNRSWRLLWILDHASEKKNDFILPILDEVYQLILQTTNESYIRHGMKLILRCPVKEEYASALLDCCVKWMNNPKAKISSQVYGLEFFYKTCELYPEMAPELLAYIEDILERNPSAGYRVRLNQIRIKLKSGK